MEGILSLDDDIFRKTGNTCPYTNRECIGYISLYISQQCHIFRISRMLEKLRERRHLDRILRKKLKNNASGYVASPYTALLSYLSVLLQHPRYPIYVTPSYF